MEFVLFIWGIIEVLNYNYNCHSMDTIQIFGLFNTLISCMFLIGYTCLICYIIIENNKNNIKIIVDQSNKFKYDKSKYDKFKYDNKNNQNIRLNKKDESNENNRKKIKCKITDI